MRRLAILFAVVLIPLVRAEPPKEEKKVPAFNAKDHEETFAWCVVVTKNMRRIAEGKNDVATKAATDDVNGVLAKLEGGKVSWRMTVETVKLQTDAQSRPQFAYVIFKACPKGVLMPHKNANDPGSLWVSIEPDAAWLQKLKSGDKLIVRGTLNGCTMNSLAESVPAGGFFISLRLTECVVEP
jgi:hypothetical protein